MRDIEVAREFGDRVMLIDFTDQFCDAQDCSAIRDGIVSTAMPITWLIAMPLHSRR